MTHREPPTGEPPRARGETAAGREEITAWLGDLAAVLAHEVKNPVTGISGALHIIGERLPAGSGDRRIVGDIRKRLGRLDRIIDELLDYARPRPRTMVPVSLRALVEAAIESVEDDPELQELEIAAELDDVEIVADAQEIRRSVQHLLTNAGRAMHGTGTVTITLQVEETHATIEVHDQGPGIPERLQSRVFDPFFTTHHRGTGLGLPLVKRLARTHGGDVELVCPPEGGTTVTLTLALKQRAIRRAPPPETGDDG